MNKLIQKVPREIRGGAWRNRMGKFINFTRILPRFRFSIDELVPHILGSEKWHTLNDQEKNREMRGYQIYIRWAQIGTNWRLDNMINWKVLFLQTDKRWRCTENGMYRRRALSYKIECVRQMSEREILLTACPTLEEPQGWARAAAGRGGPTRPQPREAAPELPHGQLPQVGLTGAGAGLVVMTVVTPAGRHTVQTWLSKVSVCPKGKGETNST